ncbi:MAG: hypothetical protein M3R47_13155 [Chloroflexota bacterium]|nr:hypothetical protein [Chloroflexota bacterium]
MIKKTHNAIMSHASLFPYDEQRRIVAYLDGLQAKVNGLWEWWLSSPECSLRGVSKPQSTSGDASQVAPAFWVPFGR